MSRVRTSGPDWLSSVPFQAFVFAVVTRILLFGINWYTLRVFPPNWSTSDISILVGGWAIWDTGYYTAIALNGYISEDPGVAAFFPLFPFLIRLVLEVSGTPLTTAAAQWVSVGIANLCFFAAIPLFARIVAARWGRAVALTATILLCVSPFSFFFNAGYTESLFLLLVVLSFQGAGEGKWVRAAIFAGLASATRSTGLALLPALLFMAWRQKAGLRDMISIAVLSPGGLLAFMVYLWRVVGDPFAFLSAQEQWSGREFRIEFFFERIFVNPSHLLYGGPDRHDLYVPVILLNVVLWLLALASLYGVFRWLGGGVAIFTALITVFHGLVSWISLGRYLLPAIGVYIVVAILLDRYKRHEMIAPLIYTCSFGLMVMLLIMFGHGHWVI